MQGDTSIQANFVHNSSELCAVLFVSRGAICLDLPPIHFLATRHLTALVFPEPVRNIAGCQRNDSHTAGENVWLVTKDEKIFKGVKRERCEAGVKAMRAILSRQAACVRDWRGLENQISIIYIPPTNLPPPSLSLLSLTLSSLKPKPPDATLCRDYCITVPSRWTSSVHRG